MLKDSVKAGRRTLFIGTSGNFAMIMATTDNALRDFLEKREPQLVSQIEKLRAELAPLETELAEVRRTKATLGMSQSRGVLTAGIPSFPRVLSTTTLDYPGKNTLAGEAFKLATFGTLTIKQLIIRALFDHFKEGADANQLREFIRDAWGRDIERSSLSPQLSRLKDQRWIELLENSAWKLTESGRHSYVMFDHPTSRAAMLKDEPSD
jgi:hypothetical protein